MSHIQFIRWGGLTLCFATRQSFNLGLMRECQLKKSTIHLRYGKCSTPLIIPARVSCIQDKEITDGTKGWFQPDIPKLLALLPGRSHRFHISFNSHQQHLAMTPKEEKPQKPSWKVRQSYKKKEGMVQRTEVWEPCEDLGLVRFPVPIWGSYPVQNHRIRNLLSLEKPSTAKPSTHPRPKHC